MKRRERKRGRAGRRGAGAYLKDPESYAFLVLANGYRRAGMYEQALEVCRAGLEHHSDYLSARVALGVILLECGHTREAQKELEVALEASPTNLLARRALADIYRESGDLDRARKAYEEILWLAPEDAEALEALESFKGAGEAAAGQTEEGKTREVEAQPKEEEKSQRVRDLRELRESVFPELAYMDISDPLYTRKLARLYEEQGNHREALAAYQMILHESPDDEAVQRRVDELVRVLESRDSLPGGSSTFSVFLPLEEKDETAAAEAAEPAEQERNVDPDFFDVSSDVEAQAPAELTPTAESSAFEGELEQVFVEPEPEGQEKGGAPPEGISSAGGIPAETGAPAADVEDLVRPEEGPPEEEKAVASEGFIRGDQEDWLIKLDGVASERGEEPGQPDIPPAAGLEDVPPLEKRVPPAFDPEPAAKSPSKPAPGSGSSKEEAIRRLEGLLKRVRTRRDQTA